LPVSYPEQVSEPARPTAVAAVVIPSGTPLHVRIDQAVDTRRSRAGDSFTASLMQPIVMNKRVVVPAGTRFQGHLTAASQSGRLKGRAVIGLTLDSFRMGGRDYRIQTSAVQQVSGKHKKRNVTIIGGGAGLGAAIGAIAGGGGGAALGALAGAGAGTAGAAATGRKDVSVPAETPLTFTLQNTVRM
jgi:hypothetical protein